MPLIYSIIMTRLCVFILLLPQNYLSSESVPLPDNENNFNSNAAGDLPDCAGLSETVSIKIKGHLIFNWNIRILDKKCLKKNSKNNSKKKNTVQIVPELQSF